MGRASLLPFWQKLSACQLSKLQCLFMEQESQLKENPSIDESMSNNEAGIKLFKEEISS